MTRALIYNQYGPIDNLHLADIALPKLKAGEVLVKVHAAALNPKDAIVRKGKFSWLSGSTFPKVVGHDFAGVVEDVGSGVQLAKGTQVYGSLNGFKCLRGTLAEAVIVKASECAEMPLGLTFEQAAALPLAAQTALQALRDLIHLKPGQRVCILGASGGVGVHAIQIAKSLQAHVTTTSSQKNLALCKDLGADVTLDYAKDNPFDLQRYYDGIFDVFGKQTFSCAVRALKSKGTYVNTIPSNKIVFDSIRSWFWGPRARLILINSNTRDLKEIASLVEKGLLKPVIDRVINLEDFKAGFEHLESRHARGKIVVRI